jgi:hypothetical protein
MGKAREIFETFPLMVQIFGFDLRFCGRGLKNLGMGEVDFPSKQGGSTDGSRKKIRKGKEG